MKPKFTKNNVEQTINLEDAFGISFKGMRSLKEAIGGAIIERIQERTKNKKSMRIDSKGRGYEGDLKAPYSKSYAESAEFKAYGKSKNNVNMTLTGDMLNLIDIKKQSGNTITIGWFDKVENNKAFNHCTGDTVPKRPFFGISKGELKDIKKEFSKDIKKALEEKGTMPKKQFEEKLVTAIQAIRTTALKVDDNG